MKGEEFIKQQIKAGYKIHFNDGVWWQRVAPLYCKPAWPFQVISRGAARPKIHLSFLAYSHVVDKKESANKFWPVLMMSNEKLKDFSITSLSSSKRARVRKGLRLNEVRRIEKLATVIDDMNSMCITVAQRTRHGKPPEYYTDKAKEWKRFMTNEFIIPHREWWGAFNEGTLVAYYYAYLVDGTMFISAAKSHSDYLHTCPNDAALFTFLEYCRDLPNCNAVIFGDWSEDVPSLNEFKERLGFVKVDLPMYTWYQPAFLSIKDKLKRYAGKL